MDVRQNKQEVDDIDYVNAAMTQDKEIKFKILKEQLVQIYDEYQTTDKVKMLHSLTYDQF